MGAVVGGAGDSVAIANVRVAVAVSAGRTTRWAQIRTTGGTGRFAWLLPVSPGARVDPASDAWLDALDAATVPVVLPPSAPSSCEGASTRQAPDVAPAVATAASQPPAAWSAFGDLPSLSAFVAAAGLRLPSPLESRLASYFSAASSPAAILVLVYPDSALPVRALRIVDAAPPVLPFALTGDSPDAANVTVFAIGGSELLPAAPLVVFPTLDLLWLSSGGSNYASLTSQLLSTSSGSWLVSSASPGPFFSGTDVTPSLSVPSVLGGYYQLAQQYGDTTADPAACTARAVPTALDTAPYAAACPPGSLVLIPGPTPCGAMSAPAETTSATPLACGSALDAAYAVAGLSPADVWVTRIEGVVTSSSAADVDVVAGGGSPTSSVSTAAGYGATCGVVGGQVGVGAGDGLDGGTDDGGESTLATGEGSWSDGEGDGGVTGDRSLDGVGAATGEIGAASGAATGDGVLDADLPSSADDGGCSGDSSGDSGGGCGGDDAPDDASFCSSAGGGRHAPRHHGWGSRFVVLLAGGLAVLRRRAKVLRGLGGRSPGRLRLG
jgi:hypothetical protein